MIKVEIIGISEGRLHFEYVRPKMCLIPRFTSWSVRSSRETVPVSYIVKFYHLLQPTTQQTGLTPLNNTLKCVNEMKSVQLPFSAYLLTLDGHAPRQISVFQTRAAEIVKISPYWLSRFIECKENVPLLYSGHVSRTHLARALMVTSISLKEH